MSIKGEIMSVFKHPNALCESQSIGDGTRIWAFAHVLAGAKIGKNCNICDGVFVENDVIVGDNVTIKCGVQLWDGTRIGNNVFIGPNASFCNDLYPRSKQYPEKFEGAIIADGASIGANATLLPNIHIGRGAMVGAGTVVTRDVPPFARVVGNPAKIIGYENNISLEEVNALEKTGKLAVGQQIDLDVNGCFIEGLPHYSDLRGELVPLEMKKGLPFEPVRVFMVYGVSGQYVRGEHAHHKCGQFLIAAHGSVSVIVDDGKQRKEVQLAEPNIGLYLAPMTWGIQYKFSSDAVLLVLASLPYDEADYIRDYDTFLSFVK